jgi:hypothetical protein
MARQQVDIGVEGNDGTGDSIRESFRKTNENFQEIYAVVGKGGQITFTLLADTPDSLTPFKGDGVDAYLPMVSQDGTSIEVRKSCKYRHNQRKCFRSWQTNFKTKCYFSTVRSKACTWWSIKCCWRCYC